MPFGLSLDDTVQDAIVRFAGRWAALEGAREQGRALTGTVGAERTIRDVLGWFGEELQPAPIEVRRGGPSSVYTLPNGPAGGAPPVITPGGPPPPTPTPRNAAQPAPPGPATP